MRKFHAAVCAVLILTLTACGASQSGSSDTGSISFKLQVKRPVTVFPVAAASADICTDYDISFINANVVVPPSNDPVGYGYWDCSLHEGIIGDVPAGRGYTIRLTGTVGGSILWSGEKSGVSVTGGEITDAGLIIMDYKGPDEIPPEISSTTPSDGAGDVPVTSVITATFNEDMAASSINDSTFILRAGGIAIPGTVVYDDHSRTATFLPSAILDYSKSYTANLTTGVEDMAGNNIDPDYSGSQWDFITESEPAAAPLAPTRIVAASGNGQNTITWDATPAATSYNIYWATASGVTKATPAKIADITTNTYTHTDLSNQTFYYYVVTSENSFRESDESYEIASSPGALDADANPPIGFISINDGAASTTSTAVILSIAASSTKGITHMFISNDNITIGSSTPWEAYTTSKSWELTEGLGRKDVFVWFKDSTGIYNTTPVPATINLN
ncbi:MAG: Ig-like domain-containing protein [Nitrospirae bacterium]|nr:Ig-like domain-containing protein [Nitrospirota bacterium]